MITLVMSDEQAQFLRALLYSKISGIGDLRDLSDELSATLGQAVGNWVIRGDNPSGICLTERSALAHDPRFERSDYVVTPAARGIKNDQPF